MKTEPKQEEIRQRPVLEISAATLHEIYVQIGSQPAETGGPLGGDEESTAIDDFFFDEGSRRSGVTYSPDYRVLNKLLQTEWNPQGRRLRGFVHSHPGWMSVLSGGDRIYAAQILRANPDMQRLWLPIVNTVPDTGDFRLTPWVAYLEGDGVRIEQAHVKVHLDENEVKDPQLAEFLSKISLDEVLEEIHFEVEPWRHAPVVDREDARVAGAGTDYRDVDVFERVREVYDLPRLADSRIVAVGAGGAASWLEEIARMGVGQFVLIDPDRVAPPNLATQQTYRRDIGRLKVDCIAERIHDINPDAVVVTRPVYLDELSDRDMKHLCRKSLQGRKPVRTILCGLTDNFWAQARVNRLALHLGLPSLCAQVWLEGRGAEVSFTYPGVTPACHRCMLNARYKAILEDGQKPDVGSRGTPIFATTRLNAIKGFVLLAMLHHGSGHPRWGSLLERIGNRNLIQVRMDPDLLLNVGIDNVARVMNGADTDRIFFDETVWLPQEADCPDTGYDYCPDCGGSGDLSQMKGRFADTRLEFPERESTEPQAATEEVAAKENPEASPKTPKEENNETIHSRQ